jgi:hypothetical protein
MYAVCIFSLPAHCTHLLSTPYIGSFEEPTSTAPETPDEPEAVWHNLLGFLIQILTEIASAAHIPLNPVRSVCMEL